MINNINFTDYEIVINRKNNRKEEVKLSDIKYSIRKRKFDRHKTEIELKEKKGLGYKTFDRLHIKN